MATGGQKQCAYCLGIIAASEVTVDHVIARSWYPADTPPVAKWKVPSCEKCNNRYSAVEQSTLTRLAFCLDPKDPSVGEIAQRALRSIRPREGKSHRDIKHRFNARQALLRDVMPITDTRARGILPSFVENFSKGSRTGIMIPSRALEGVVIKWIRGVHFCEFGHPVPADHEVSAYFVDDEVAATAFGEILQHANRIQKGPGIEVLIWQVTEGDLSITQYAFNIWQQFRAYGSVESPGLD
jgi:hypothetical protein